MFGIAIPFAINRMGPDASSLGEPSALRLSSHSTKLPERCHGCPKTNGGLKPPFVSDWSPSGRLAAPREEESRQARAKQPHRRRLWNHEHNGVQEQEAGVVAEVERNRIVRCHRRVHHAREVEDLEARAR